MADWARVTRFEDRPGGVDAAVKQFREALLPPMQKSPGYKAAYLLIDRKTGRGSAVTIWASEDALQASEDRAAKLRADATQEQKDSGLTMWGVERYEVLVADVGGGSGIGQPSTGGSGPLGARVAQPRPGKGDPSV